MAHAVDLLLSEDSSDEDGDGSLGGTSNQIRSKSDKVGGRGG